MGVPLLMLLLILFGVISLDSLRREYRTDGMRNCKGCGRSFIEHRYTWWRGKLVFEGYRGYCSKYCLARAETMDFPANAKPIYSDSSPSSPVEDENSEKPSLKSILRYIFFFIVIIYAFLSILAIFDIT
tara:strand:- start:449 stop:835 length:387 start_codon:yes stop_codon:yes gene_type:complete